MSYFIIVVKIHGYNGTTRDFGLNLARFNLPTYHQCGYAHFSHVIVMPTFKQISIKLQINNGLRLFITLIFLSLCRLISAKVMPIWH